MKKWLSAFLTLTILLTLCVFAPAAMAGDEIPSITEMEANPSATTFSVSTAEEFKAFADLVTAGNTFSGITIVQTATINLSAYPNLQVGTARAEASAFAGTYDGQNNTISGYSFSDSSALYVGLFKGLSGTIKNLVIDGASVSAKTHSGILVGETYGTANLIDNVHIKNSTITVADRRAAFMLYGFNNGAFTVKNCTVSGCTMNTGTVTGNPVGLIATKADGSGGNVVENTYVFNNTINVQAASTSFGEILGDGRCATVTNCGTFGNTYTGTAVGARHGIVTAANATNTKITNCYTDVSALAGNGVLINNYTGVTATAIADGTLAYTLKTTSDANWMVKDGYAQVGSGSAVTKQTYVVDGETYATLYTDYDGKVIGTVTDPELEGYTFDGWTETADGEEGDKLFTANLTEIPTVNEEIDLNNDGANDTADVTALLQYVNGSGTVDTEKADLNGDGMVTLADALRLLKLLNA